MRWEKALSYIRRKTSFDVAFRVAEGLPSVPIIYSQESPEYKKLDREFDKMPHVKSYSGESGWVVDVRKPPKIGDHQPQNWTRVYFNSDSYIIKPMMHSEDT